MTLAEKLQQARSGAAFGPPLHRGLLRLTGKHRVGFLHRISTQALAKLAPESSAYTSFLDVKGHVVAEGTALVREDEVLLDVAAEARDALIAYLRKYIIMDDVKVHAVPEEIRVLPVFGPAGIAAALSSAPSVASFATSRHGEASRDFVVGPDDASRLREALSSSGATELSEGDLEAMRVMAGVPRWGAEIEESRLVLETSIVPSAVSFEKGCYIGQEVVARGTFRGQVQRGLVQLEIPASANAPLALIADGHDVGVLTSAADTPVGRLALGYVRRAFWNVGQRLTTAAGEVVVRRVLVQERDEPGSQRPSLLSNRPPPASR